LPRELAGADHATVTDDERQKANKSCVDNLLKIQGHINSKELPQLESKAKNTFLELRLMIWVTFLSGLFLIGMSIYLSYARGTTVEAVGLGSLGVADWLALIFYKPMDRLQRASADFGEQLMIEASWIMAVNLHLLAMRVGDPKELQDAAKNIIMASWRSSKDVRSIIKEESDERQESKGKSESRTTSVATQPSTS
jgi:hypothetical protein